MLDIGAGYGAMAVACQRSGVAFYLGIDPWPFGADIIKREGFDPGFRQQYESCMPEAERSRFCFFEGLVEQLQGWEGYFDFCIIFDVLEHVSDFSNIASACFRLLRPSGRLITISGPLYWSSKGHHLLSANLQPWAHLKEGFAPSTPPVPPYLLNAFLTLGKTTHADIKAAFTAAGFHVVHENVQLEDQALWDKHKDSILPEFRSRMPEDIFRQSDSEILFIKPANTEELLAIARQQMKIGAARSFDVSPVKVAGTLAALSDALAERIREMERLANPLHQPHKGGFILGQRIMRRLMRPTLKHQEAFNAAAIAALRDEAKLLLSVVAALAEESKK